jgi:signal transduction histidine kinase
MASFRLAVLGTLFSTLGAVVVFALIYAATARAEQAEFTPIIASERADLVSDAAQDGVTLPVEIARAIAESPHSFYALADAAGRPLAGNIAMPPDALDWQTLTRWDGFPLPSGVLQIDGMGGHLPGGETLFIGEDASAFAALNTHIAYLFGGIFGFTIALGLLASLLIAYYSLQRVTAISQTSHEIMAGDLTRRVKLYGIDDELDFLTADLNEMLGSMQELVETARQVTSDIAHDLRSPLTRLRDHLELSRRATAEPAASEAFAAALARLDEIFRIFDAVLRIAEVEAGAVRGHFAPVDLSRLCRGMAETFAPVAEDKGQILTTDIEGGLVAPGDSALLTQMLVNVLENAIHHCPPRVPLRLRLFRQAGEIVIEMADRGPGIPEPDRERVFSRFVRLESARQSAGNGLGLPLVKAVAALHGGQVSLLDNRPGLILRISWPREAYAGTH